MDISRSHETSRRAPGDHALLSAMIEPKAGHAELLWSALA